MTLGVRGTFAFADYESGGRRGSDTDLHFDYIINLLLTDSVRCVEGFFNHIPIFPFFLLTHIYTAYNSPSNNYTSLFNLATSTLHLTSDGERLQPEAHRLLN